MRQDADYYDVWISREGYHVVDSFRAMTLVEAARRFLAGRNPNHFARVLRDGRTGKRYSVAECLEMAE